MQENHLRYAAPEDVPGLRDLVRTPPNVHFQLFPDQQVLKQGFEAYADERVESMRFNSSKNRLEASVFYSDGRFKVTLSPENRNLAHTCDCRQWRPTIGCKHVVAVYAMMMNVLQGRSFYVRAPDPSYVEILHKGLLESALGRKRAKPAKKQQQPTKRKITAVSESGGAQLIFYSNHPDTSDLLKAIGFHRYYSTSWMHGRSTQGDRYFHDDIDEALPDLAVACSEMDVELYLQYNDSGSDENMEVQIRPGIVEVPVRAVLDRSGMGVRFSLLPVDQQETVLAWSDPELGLAIDTTGRLLTPEDAAPFEWIERLSQTSYQILDLAADSDASESRSVFKYNLSALNFDLTWKDYSPDNLALTIEGEPWTLPEDPVDGTFTLVMYKVMSGRRYVFHAFPVLEVDGALIEARGLIKELATDLIGDRYDSRLWGAKARAERLTSAIHNLLLLETKADRSACIKEAVSHPVFKRQRLTNKARDRLRKIEKNWVELDSAVTILTSDDEINNYEENPPPLDPRWLLVRVPRRQIARAALALWGTRSYSDLQAFGEHIEIPEEGFIQFLTQAAAAVSSVGGKIKIDGEYLRNAPVEIDVEARESDQIDWFELRAQIRCDSLTLSDDQWRALVNGELLLRDKDGRFIVPEIGNRMELLQRLRSLTSGKQQKHGIEAKVSRLQILDWLELRRHGASVKIPRQAEELFNSLQNFKELPTRPLPEGINAELRPYQHRGYDWLEFLYDHRFGACLADDMGLGKTLQAICFLAAHTPETGSSTKNDDEHPHLVVVPPSLLFNWLSEIQRFCPRLRVAEYAGSQRNWKTACKASVILTTYDIVRIDQRLFEKQPFHIVIFDEAQLVKNLSTARAKAARAVKGRFALCLTGTPMENHLGEYHAIIDLALPGLMGTAREFNQAVKTGEQQRLLNRAQPFVLRRTKERILDELPPKVETDLYLDMTPSQKELYTRAVGEVRREVLAAYADKPRQQAGIMALAALTRLRQICISPGLLGAHENQISPKFEHLLETLQEINDEGHSALVFSQFTKSLDLLQAELSKANIAFVRLDGSTPTAKRKEVVRKFQESDTPHTFLISLKAGGAGLNLTRASYVFHLDPWWNPAVEHQASDRAHRIGQKQTVFVNRLLMRHTVEEKIQTLKARKQALFDAVVENPAASRNTANLLSPDDFNFLLNTEPAE